MTLDPFRPEHRAALQWACRWFESHGHRKGSVGPEPTGGLDAVRALSSPSDSASIVCVLLEPWLPGVGTDYDDFGDTWRIDIAYDNEDEDAPLLAAVVPRSRGPALILALLACTTKEEAIAALREAGR